MDAELGQQFGTKRCEPLMGAIARTGVVHFHDFVNPATTLGENDNSIRKVKGFVDVVSYQHNGCTSGARHLEQQILH
jgi:hypothetical protein